MVPFQIERIAMTPRYPVAMVRTQARKPILRRAARGPRRSWPPARSSKAQPTNHSTASESQRVRSAPHSASRSGELVSVGRAYGDYRVRSDEHGAFVCIEVLVGTRLALELYETGVVDLGAAFPHAACARRRRT